MLTQTRRHSQVVALLGVRQIVVAVNKMDLVDYSETRFQEIEEEYRAFAAPDRARAHHRAFPCSALRGDNVIRPQR